MKKILLIALTAIIGQAATAQKSNVKAAEVAYFAKDYEKGVKAITEAMNNEQTKADPKTYYLASLLFSSLNDDAANAAKAYYRTETNHLFSVIKLKADYEKDNVNILLMNCANSYFNAAQEAFFNEKNYQAAINHFDTVEMINKCGDGKRFAGNLAFDTVVALGKRLKVYAYNSLNKTAENMALLKEVAANPIVTNPDMYLFILDAYEQQKDEANFLKTIVEAKAKYADNKAIANRELNYYIKAGKQDELVKKLEDVITKDPNNAELLFTLGITYENLSKNGKDKLGKPMVDPTLVAKAEASYLKAIQANGNQADYQYNLGALYYNNAVEINKQMNAIAGSSAAEIKKYEALKKQRDEVFNKGLPYLAKAAEIVSTKDASTQSADDKSTLQSAYQAQVQIYNALGNKAKAEEFKKKISEIR
jgi:hypothetical protein